jgi:hypothetical protein
VYQELTTDPRTSGANTVVMNANWGPDYAGPMWGTHRSEVNPSPDCEQGGVWEGTWTGTMNIDGSYTYHAVGKVFPGAYQGCNTP